jgi:hypothetical protein
MTQGERDRRDESMSGSAKNWLIGCGVGCGFLIVLGLGLGAAGFYGVRHVAKRADRIEAAGAALAERFGPPESYVPPVDGSLDPARVEAFLDARRRMASARERTGKSLAVLDGSGGGGVAAKIVAGANFVPTLMSFMEERDKALLDAGIGNGEYRYIYTLAYFNLLGKDPGDGPGFQMNSNGDEDGAGWSASTRHETGGDNDRRRDEARRERAQGLRRALNGTQRENLRLQLEALKAAGAGSGANAAWRAQLAAEVEAMDNERGRLAWEQGLPERMRQALDPFRQQLDELYDPMTGALELGMNDGESGDRVRIRFGDGDSGGDGGGEKQDKGI